MQVIFPDTVHIFQVDQIAVVAALETHPIELFFDLTHRALLFEYAPDRMKIQIVAVYFRINELSG